MEYVSPTPSVPYRLDRNYNVYFDPIPGVSPLEVTGPKLTPVQAGEIPAYSGGTQTPSPPIHWYDDGGDVNKGLLDFLAEYASETGKNPLEGADEALPLTQQPFYPEYRDFLREKAAGRLLKNRLQESAAGKLLGNRLRGRAARMAPVASVASSMGPAGGPLPPVAPSTVMSSTVPPRQQPRGGGLQPSGGGGLLDSLYNKQGMTPLGMGLLSGFASLLASSGYKPYPRSIGAQLGQGLLGGLQGYSGQQAYLDRRQQALEKAQREKLMLGLQMEQYVRSQQQQDALTKAYPDLVSQIPNEKARNYLEKLPPQLGLKIIQDNAKTLFPFSKSEVVVEDGIIKTRTEGGDAFAGIAPVPDKDQAALYEAYPEMIKLVPDENVKAILGTMSPKEGLKFIQDNPKLVYPNAFPTEEGGPEYVGLPLGDGRVAVMDKKTGQVRYVNNPEDQKKVKAPITLKGSDLGAGFQPNAYYMQNKQGTWDLINPQEFNQRRGLTKDYTSETDGHSEVARAYQTILDSINGPGGKNGMTDQVVITAFKKILDPTSAVMQGEFDSVSGSMGSWEKIKNQYGKVDKGDQLTTQARNDLLNAITTAAKVWAQDAKKKVDSFRKTAERFGFNDMNFVNPFEGMDLSGGGGGSASSNRTAEDLEKRYYQRRL